MLCLQARLSQLTLAHRAASSLDTYQVIGESLMASWINGHSDGDTTDLSDDNGSVTDSATNMNSFDVVEVPHSPLVKETLGPMVQKPGNITIVHTILYIKGL